MSNTLNVTDPYILGVGITLLSAGATLYSARSTVAESKRRAYLASVLFLYFILCLILGIIHGFMLLGIYWILVLAVTVCGSSVVWNVTRRNHLNSALVSGCIAAIGAAMIQWVMAGF